MFLHIYISIHHLDITFFYRQGLMKTEAVFKLQQLFGFIITWVCCVHLFDDERHVGRRQIARVPVIQLGDSQI